MGASCSRPFMDVLTLIPNETPMAIKAKEKKPIDKIYMMKYGSVSPILKLVPMLLMAKAIPRRVASLVEMMLFSSRSAVLG